MQPIITNDSDQIAETCQLAVRRIKWLQNSNRHDEKKLSANTYMTVDPAPASEETNVNKLRSTLLDESLPLYERYRAMFSLRNKGDEDSVLALAEGKETKLIEKSKISDRY